jgi:hypothetical protein
VQPEQKIYYTVDGSEPTQSSTRYTKPICLKENTKIRAIAYLSDVPSKIIETSYFKIPADWNINIHSQYSKHYSAGGPRALIDFQRGGNDFRTGAWQGYQGQDFSATIDLGKVQRISRVGGNFIQEIRSWIWMPKHLEVYVSRNGKRWRKVAHITHEIPDNSYENQVKELSANIKPRRARYVKFVAPYYGKIPKWHLGAGGEAFIFIDELIVE